MTHYPEIRERLAGRLARVAGARRPRPAAAGPPTLPLSAPPELMSTVEAGFVIGRSRTCHLVLDESTVSRRHAELRRDGASWVVADLGSTNGTRVNGWRVQRARLHPGDELTLGGQRLRFVAGP